METKERWSCVRLRLTIRWSYAALFVVRTFGSRLTVRRLKKAKTRAMLAVRCSLFEKDKKSKSERRCLLFAVRCLKKIKQTALSPLRAARSAYEQRTVRRSRTHEQRSSPLPFIRFNRTDLPIFTAIHFPQLN
ncbi:hypothetical protein [Pseudidiomarina piscicola]|uniref:hypothetical protein n=1 Tax=Pseudidiomarina piscicola TaxID=2614830 RepID=UPI00156E4954|nr:hypothetical protein [Pseudidiomarina piscicola]